jgi:dynein intermediate chain 1
MAVSSIKWNQFHKDIFLSSSDDWLIKVWSQNSQTALFSFDLQSPVGDISWSIFSSTAFGAVTSDGKCFIYDLNINKYQVQYYSITVSQIIVKPLCEQVVVQKKKTKITKLEFNPEYPVCLIGDSRGNSTM